VVAAHASTGDHVISVGTEHAAVLDTLRALGRRGVRATVLPVDGDGRVDPSDVAKAIEPHTVLVSVGAANGEIGALQPLGEIARVCAERDVLFHSDAAQALGKIPLDVEALGLDLLSASAHKLYGPKGVGLLYVRLRRRSGARLRVEPLLFGGGQERGMRSGTLPVPLIVGFAEAVTIAVAELAAEAARLAALRDALLDALRAALPGVHVNGPARAGRLPGNLNVSFDGVAADALIAALEDVALSSGSACSSARPEPSHVLAALGLPAERAHGAVRMGLGRGTRPDDVARAAERIADAVRAVRGERAALGLAR
jgi:cysteine desulfurase